MARRRRRTSPPHASFGRGGRAAMLDIHRSLDRMVGQLVDAVRDATVIVFNMGGMGPNSCDIQSMVLLPELLYRHAFGRQLLTLPAAWTATPNLVPILDERTLGCGERILDSPPRQGRRRRQKIYAQSPVAFRNRRRAC